MSAGRRSGAIAALALLHPEMVLAQAIPVADPEMTGREVFLGVVIGVMVLCGLLSWLLYGRASESTHVALAMFVVLAGAFGLLVLLGGVLHREPIAAIFLFLLLLALFKLMSQFEARRKSDRTDPKR
jgi:uncharacterized membrane protein YfcA